MLAQPWVAERAKEFLSPFPSRRRQRAPDRQKSYERRHRLAFSGVMPRWLAERLTVGAMAVMRIVADLQRERGYCDLSLAEIAARAGVCRKTALRAMHAAGPDGEGLISIQERPRRGRKHLTNVVRIVSPEWLSWLARGATHPCRTGGHLRHPTDNRCLKQSSKSRFDAQQEGNQGGQYGGALPTRSPPGIRRRSYG